MGKSTAVTLYEPLADTFLSDELAGFSQALQLYRGRQWAAARTEFQQLQTANPGCKLYSVYSERIEAYSCHPPAADWDGVYDFDSK